MSLVAARTPSPWIVALALVLSGCVSAESSEKKEESGPGPAPPAAPTGDTGSVQGTVTDDSFQPIASAQLLLQEAEMTAVTDAAGAFTFNGVAPGSYSLFAAALGYESLSKRIEVRAAEITSATFKLAPLPVKEPYYETWGDRGYFECSWSIWVARGPCFFPGPQPSFPNNRRQFDYVVAEGAMTVVVEMTWKRTSVATGEAMSIFLSYTKRTTQHWYCLGDAPNPVYLRWDRGELDAKQGTCNTGNQQLPSSEPQAIPIEGQNLTARANVGRSPVLLPTVGLGFGVALQQTFEIFFSNFYWEPAPEKFSGLPDA